MNKDIIKGFLILASGVVGLAIFALVATDNGPQKVSCMFRAVTHGVALTNIAAVCGL